MEKITSGRSGSSICEKMTESCEDANSPYYAHQFLWEPNCLYLCYAWLYVMDAKYKKRVPKNPNISVRLPLFNPACIRKKIWYSVNTCTKYTRTQDWQSLSMDQEATFKIEYKNTELLLKNNNCSSWKHSSFSTSSACCVTFYD